MDYLIRVHCWFLVIDPIFSSVHDRFDRVLKKILRDELHWLDVPERIEYKLGVTRGVCTDGHLGTSQIASSQPLMLLLAVIVYVLQT